MSDSAPDYHADDPICCIICGEPIDYCLGHGDHPVYDAHDSEDHSHCHPNGCERAAYDTMQ